MRSHWFKYIFVGILLITYINRGFFVSAPEAEPIHTSTSGKYEINSLIEFLIWVASGYENDIDEDGNTPESYHFAKVIDPTDHHLLYSVTVERPYTIIHRIQVPLTEQIPAPPTYGTVDHPPEA